MADAKKTEAPAEGEEAPKKKKKLLIIIIAAVLVLVLGGGTAFFLMKKKSADEEAAADEGDEPPAKTAKAKAKKKKDEHAAPPVFAKLEPFVVKLQSDQQEAYVQAIPELKLLDAMVSEQVKQFMPEIRHKVLMILAGKKAAELSAPEGMQALANQIRETINATLKGEKPDPAMAKQDTADPEAPVQAVFFSSLIVQ